MSRPIDLEKLRSINVGGRTKGQSRVRQLTNEESGAATGYEIDYADGRVEAVVRPAPVVVTKSVKTGEVHIG